MLTLILRFNHNQDLFVRKHKTYFLLGSSKINDMKLVDMHKNVRKSITVHAEDDGMFEHFNLFITQFRHFWFGCDLKWIFFSSCKGKNAAITVYRWLHKIWKKNVSTKSSLRSEDYSQQHTNTNPIVFNTISSATVLLLPHVYVYVFVGRCAVPIYAQRIHSMLTVQHQFYCWRMFMLDGICK